MHTGDIVFHPPSNEEWIVDFIENGYVCTCGWLCSVKKVEGLPFHKKESAVVYVEMHYHGSDYISIHVEAIAQEPPLGVLLSQKVGPYSATPEDYMAMIAQLPILLRAVHNAGYQAAVEGYPTGHGFHLEQVDDRRDNQVTETARQEPNDDLIQKVQLGDRWPR